MFANKEINRSEQINQVNDLLKEITVKYISAYKEYKTGITLLDIGIGQALIYLN